MTFTDEWLFLCHDCAETFCHPDSVARHGKEKMHFVYSVYRKVE